MTARSALAFSPGAAGPLLASVVAGGKRCPACVTVKPKADFSRKRSNPGGLQTYCRDCARESRRASDGVPLASGAELPPVGEALAAPDDDLSWRDAARCAQSDPDEWFPEKGESSRMAKRICHGCPVRAECLEFALDSGQEFGIWGGLSEFERRPLLAARDQAAQAA